MSQQNDAKKIVSRGMLTDASLCRAILKENDPLSIEDPFVKSGITSRYDYMNVYGNGQGIGMLDKHQDFLYEVNVDDIDYDQAYEYFEQLSEKEQGGAMCSAFRHGNWYGRNLDWYYNNMVDFVVRTPAKYDEEGNLVRHASIGVAGMIPGLNYGKIGQEVVVDGYNMYEIMPFYMLDGINDAGLFCNSNVTPIDNNTWEVPAETGDRKRISRIMLIRYLLDNYSSADEAVSAVQNDIQLFNLIRNNYHVHWMIGDKDKTYVIELINGQISVVENPIMTNFHLTGVTFNEDGTVPTAENYANGGPQPTAAGIDPLGAGLERYNVIASNIDSIVDQQSARAVIDKVLYSRAYPNTYLPGGVAVPFWYSESTGAPTDRALSGEMPDEVITVDTDPSLCTALTPVIADMFKNRDRNRPEVWTTSHSCIYDIENKAVYIISQETSEEMKFEI